MRKVNTTELTDIHDIDHGSDSGTLTVMVRIDIKDTFHHFELKETTLLSTLFNSVSELIGKPLTVLIFHFGPYIFSGDKTPAMVGLKDGDTIDCIFGGLED